uniref:Uncharacterized protein n=1 Tax=Arundo donax TaxID=35708 RepID=A0A0A9Q5L2_ARUDO
MLEFKKQKIKDRWPARALVRRRLGGLRPYRQAWHYLLILLCIAPGPSCVVTSGSLTPAYSDPPRVKTSATVWASSRMSTCQLSSVASLGAAIPTRVRPGRRMHPG